MATLAIFRPRRIASGSTFCAIPDPAHGYLRRFHQQETQQRVPLFRDVPQAPPLPARLQRHQSQIARDLPYQTETHLLGQ